MVPTIEDLRFNTLRNALYHKARQRVLEFIDKIFNLLVIMLGTTQAADFFKGGISSFDVWVGFITAFLGAIQLVYNPGGQAKINEFMQRQFYDILAEMDECSNPDDRQLCSWNAKLTRLYGEQSPVLNALDSIAYNQTAASLGFPKEKNLYIGFFKSTFRHVLPFNSSFFETIEERRERVRKSWDPIRSLFRVRKRQPPTQSTPQE